MGLYVLHDPEHDRALLFDSVTERPLSCEAFIGDDAREQAEDFLTWYDGLRMDPPDVRRLDPKQLDTFLRVWHAVAFDDDEQFVGAMPV